MTPTKRTPTPPATTSTSILTTSFPTSRKTITTSTVRSVVTKKKPDTATKERSTPRCRCKSLRTTLPFSDLRHRLINAVAESLLHDDGCQQRKRTNLRERSEETFGRLQRLSKHRQPSFPGSWTKSRDTRRPLKPLRDRSGPWPLLPNNKFRPSSGRRPGSSRSSWSGLRRPWLHRHSRTQN